jgi:ADP-heptose:LPS heptosyltransferase
MSASSRLQQAWRLERDQQDQATTPPPIFGDVRRMLIVRDDRLGDLVVSLPAIHQLRRQYPAAEIALLVQPGLEPLAASVAGVSKVLVNSGSFGEQVARIRRFDPQLGVAISRRAETAWQLSRAAVPHRVGTARRWFSPLFTRRVEGSRRHAGAHEVDYAMEFAQAAGATGSQRCFDIELSDQVRSDAADWCRRRSLDSNVLILHPGSGGSCPAWPLERWAELIRLLQSRGEPFVVSCGPADRATVATLRSELEPFPCFEGELMQLAALLAGARGVVSNSTGPIHLAAALGSPTLAIHAPWTSCAPARWAPYDARGYALVVGEGQTRGWSRRRRRRFGEALVGQLSAEELLGTLDRLAAVGGGWIEGAAGVH